MQWIWWWWRLWYASDYDDDVDGDGVEYDDRYDMMMLFNNFCDCDDCGVFDNDDDFSWWL